MAAPQQNAGSGALEACGLERILEALKLLLNPGGERTDLGAGLYPGLSGRPVFKGCSGCHTVRPSGPPRDLRPPRPVLGIVCPTSYYLILVEEIEIPGGIGSVEYWY